jgi:predicted nucleic acid-binding protein
MAVDPSVFYTINVVDTCSIWNILSSNLLYNAAMTAKCTFSCTQFVYYECLHKPRQKSSEEDFELQRRYKRERRKGKFSKYHIAIEDLHNIEILERRKKLSKGELSSIIFAKKTQQAFMTDDQGARRLAEQVMDKRKVQTTPHLFGWLIYSDFLSDSDKDQIIKEHKLNGRPLEKHFKKIYLKALELKLAHANVGI